MQASLSAEIYSIDSYPLEWLAREKSEGLVAAADKDENGWGGGGSTTWKSCPALSCWDPCLRRPDREALTRLEPPALAAPVSSGGGTSVPRPGAGGQAKLKWPNDLLGWVCVKPRRDPLAEADSPLNLNCRGLVGNWLDVARSGLSRGRWDLRRDDLSDRRLFDPNRTGLLEHVLACSGCLDVPGSIRLRERRQRANEVGGPARRTLGEEVLVTRPNEEVSGRAVGDRRCRSGRSRIKVVRGSAPVTVAGEDRGLHRRWAKLEEWTYGRGRTTAVVCASRHGRCRFHPVEFVRYWLEQHPEEVVVYDVLTYAGNRPNCPTSKTASCSSTATSVTASRREASAARDRHRRRLRRGVPQQPGRARPGAVLPHERARHQALLEAARQVGMAASTTSGPARSTATWPSIRTRPSRRTPPTGPARPTTPPRPARTTPVRAYAETYELPITITNCSNNYGPYQFPEKVIPLFSAQPWTTER